MDDNSISVQIIKAGRGVCERCGAQSDQLYYVTFIQGEESNSHELCRRCTAAAKRFAERCRREETAESEEETVPPEEEPAPQEEETAPQEEETAPPEEKTAPQEEETAPQEEEIAPPEEETVPQEETAPPEEETVPQEETAPPEEEIAPPEEKAAPKQDPFTIPEPPVPLKNKAASAAKYDAPAESPADPADDGFSASGTPPVYFRKPAPAAAPRVPEEAPPVSKTKAEAPDRRSAPNRPAKRGLPKVLLVVLLLLAVAAAFLLGLHGKADGTPLLSFSRIHKQEQADEPADATDAPTETTAAPTTEPEPEDEDVDDSLIQKLSSVLIVDDAGYEYYNFSQATADRYAAVVSHAADSLKGTARVFDLVVPTSMDITLSDPVRKRINSDDQKQAIDYIYAAVSQNAVTVNTFDALRAHRKEYVYFRTDHHWTALGAYYAYREYAAAAGLRTAELSEFTERKFENFVGAFYNDSGKKKALEKNPDTVYAYEPKMTNEMTFTDKSGKETKWHIITDVSNWSRGTRYNTFIGGDQPYAYISYPNEAEPSTCVVIKESFGNAFVPFLLANYNEIHVIDYRYWKGDLAQFVRSVGAKDVIFVNNVSATRNAALVKQLDAIS